MHYLSVLFNILMNVVYFKNNVLNFHDLVINFNEKKNGC